MNMMHVGRDATIPDLQRLKLKRVKRGECPECGTQLFKTATGMLGRIQKKTTPIEEAGKSFHGRCLICFPLVEEDNNDEVAISAVKKSPVPQIILTCQTNMFAGSTRMMNNDGTIKDKTEVSCFGIDDDVSAITLDRRIRTDKEEIDNGNSGYDQLYSADTKRGQAVLVDNYDEGSESSLRARMEKFLKEDDAKVHSSDEEIDDDDEDPKDMIWEAPPEQAPTRGIPKSKIDATDKEVDDDFGIVVSVESNMGIKVRGKSGISRWAKLQRGKSELAIGQANEKARRSNSESILQRQFSQSVSAAKKPFLLSTVFVPSSTDEDSQYKNNIILEEPDEKNKKTAGESGHEEGESTKKDGPSAEIVFDSAAYLSTMEEVQVKLEVREQAAGPVSIAVEKGFFSSQESAVGFATESSSCHDADENGAYSSQLLGMLKGTKEAEGENQRVVTTDVRSSNFQLEAVQAELVTNELSSNEGTKEAEHKMEDTIPTTANSSHLTSYDGTSLRGSHVKELPNDLESPMKEAGEVLVGPSSPRRKSPRKRPPPGLKLAPVTTLNAPSSPKKVTLASPPTALNTKQKSAFNNPLHDIPTLLCQLQSGPTEDHGKTLVRLSDSLWTQGPAAKQLFVDSNGIKVLTSTMWADMVVPSAELAAVELFLAFVSMSATDVQLGNEDMEGLIDALLITMQTLISDAKLQQVGCRVLCCMSSSINGYNDNDGTRPGACLAVLNALDAHNNSDALLEWGLRTLYNQCVHSKHAETNKRTLLNSRLGTSGATGGDFLERMLLNVAHRLRGGAVLEWTCRLCWCLTACRPSVAVMFALKMDAVRELLHILEHCRSMDSAQSLIWSL
jgi:hypothetical protein